MLRKYLPAVAAALLLNACQRESAYDPARDYYSHANAGAFVTDHLVLDLDVDFASRRLSGTATLHMRNLHPHERRIVLDTRDLDVRAVSVGLPGDARASIPFRLGQRHELLGQPLEIDLPDGFDPQGGFELEISYATSPDASALQWLPAELTSGGKLPLMFSQSQAIHSRSWVPLQDTAAVRITYAATIRTPPGMRALMSADNDPQTPRASEYRFAMPQPIPPYLLAIAVGDFQFAPIGPDTGVYAEIELLDAAAFEFAETQAMLDVAEKQLGPYDWGRYDLLILPPSFPYGGMENPRLSFITPSVLAGDRSLVSLIAHELAHSWSGNKVTYATLRDNWLNEGTTSYLEARLMEDLFGPERADEERALTWASLQRLLQLVPAPYQPLAPELRPVSGESPQRSMQYAKGQFFLEHLERLFGRAQFDAFMAGYFEQFKWQSITTEQFLDYLDQHLLSARPGVFSREQAGEWLYRPGVPADFEIPRAASLERAAAAALSWSAGEVPAAEIPVAEWSPHALAHFINSLPPELSLEQLREVDGQLGLSATNNALVARAWFTQVARRRFREAYPAMREHLTRHGRMYLITPVYRALIDNGEDSGLAAEIYAGAKGTYHPITSRAVARLLAPAGESH